MKNFYNKFLFNYYKSEQVASINTDDRFVFF